MITVLTNALIFDGTHADLKPGHVVIEDDRIVEVAAAAPSLQGEHTVVDVRGHTLMPGLIDAHVHAHAPDVNYTLVDRMPMSLVAHWAHVVMRNWLRRGFTTVRDTGGGDQGLCRAVSQGWLDGPRLIYCGPAFTQTGGGGDFRDPHDHDHVCLCACESYVGHGSRVIDGADALRAAIREEFRRGASFIKILASGAVAAPSNALDRAEFCDEEIAAMVDETGRYGSYVTAHVHPDAAARRCIELGVPFLEHASLVSEETATLAATRDVRVVPTLAVGWAFKQHGAEIGVPRNFLEKVARVQEQIGQSVEYLKRAGVRTGFGTDCLGQLDKYQCMEFKLRSEIWSPAEILRQATSGNARILGLGGVGEVANGFKADLIVVDGNPLEDLGVFRPDGRDVRLVVKDGVIVKDDLDDM
jgi:imidazolonepropionase-like amidohydrolase